MSVPRFLAVCSAGLIAVAHASPASALPTMIRIGYAGCASCHYAPQGGGPLNPYGRSIDEAQSLRGGEYRTRENALVKALSWGGRIAQDLRLVMPMQRAMTAHQSAVSSLRSRLMYRNVTELPRGFSAHATITAETDAAPRPALAYDPAVRSATAFVNTALLRYRASETLEIAAGRDQLPSGLNIPDLAAFFKARNRMGYYDAPTQLKVHWSGKRHQVTPFVYGAGGNEAAGEGESGVGALAEFDLFGSQNTVVGMSVLRGGARHGDRKTAGAYARLGFGAWGILAQHDLTYRGRSAPLDVSFQQRATYAQVFWAAREWLVASAIGERLSVDGPFEERLTAGKLEVAARLASVATIGAGARLQRDMITGRLSTSLMLQLALKTVY